MPNGYCFSHQHLAPKTIPFYRKPAIMFWLTIVGVALALGGIWLTFHFGWLGATKEDQKKTHDNQAEMQSDLDEVKQILKERDVAEELYRDKFVERYDLGYCLIAINKQKRVVSTPKASIGHFTIDWAPFKIIEYVPGYRVKLFTPTVITPKKVRYYGNVLNLTTKRKEPKVAIVSTGEFTPYVEIVSETTEGLIVLFGISSIKLPD